MPSWRSTFSIPFRNGCVGGTTRAALSGGVAAETPFSMRGPDGGTRMSTGCMPVAPSRPSMMSAGDGVRLSVCEFGCVGRRPLSEVGAWRRP